MIRVEMLDRPPEPLPIEVLDELGRFLETTSDVERAYLVAQRRTDERGAPTQGRSLFIVVRDAPADEPVSDVRSRGLLNAVSPVLANGASDVAIAFPAPRALPAVERGLLVWSREATTVTPG